MFERIVYISDHSANVKLVDGYNVTMNLMNLHIIFEDNMKKILGEVDDLDGNIVKVRFLGEIVNGKLLAGVIRKPSLDAKIRVIEQNEIPMICGTDAQGYLRLGVSPFYNDYPVFLDVNNFFSNHFAIFGNSGSGKSCGISRLFQNMFHDQRLFPYKANIVLFDSSGEYYNAFKDINSINSNYHYRFYSTNEVDGKGEKLRIPVFLLNESDLALLLQATSHSQLPIIERMLKLALVFSQTDMDANNYKNHLIAKAIMTILYTNETSPNKRNEIFSILASCSTPEFNLEAVVQGVGYTRKFRECFLIDSQGQFSESVLLTEYVSSFIKNEYDNYEPQKGVYYSLDTLEKALNFTLISEGWLRNENTYGDAVTIKVRLHALIVGQNSKFFDYPDFVSLETYLSSMLINNGNKYQIVNINLDDVDDDFAKVITKIYSRLIFEFAKGLKERASIPFHIVVEEAHRYIQNDTDRFLIGYNIFEKQKTLQAGTCLGFGMAFRIPLIVKMEMPNPAPWSGNCDVVTIWNGNGNASVNTSAPVNEVVNATKEVTPDTTSSQPNQFVNNSVPVNPFLEQEKVEEKSTLTVPTVPNSTNAVQTSNNNVPQVNNFNQNNMMNLNAPSTNMTDNMINTSNNPVPTIAGYSLDNSMVQSALPDFSAPSQPSSSESSFDPNQFLSVPSTLDMVSNNSTVSPTVQLENNKDDYGSVRIAPPTENNVSNNLGNNFDFGNNSNLNMNDGFSQMGPADNNNNNFVQNQNMNTPNNNSSMVPTTDKGVPLINIVE